MASGEAPIAGSATPLTVAVEHDERVNLALQQNGTPLVRRLALRNDGDTPVTDLALRLWVEPELADPLERQVERLEPGGTQELSQLPLELSPTALAGRRERTRGAVGVEVRSGGEVLHRARHPLEVLAAQEWLGVAAPPELLAAHVQPNAPALRELLRATANRLGAWTGRDALDGYRSGDPERARTTAAALYVALQDAGLTYVHPPASFEHAGQKVRPPEELLAGRMGTCLDLAVGAAAVLEQAGLHPLVVLVAGHAFAGVRLEPTPAPEPALHEGLRLLKEVELGEAEVFDPTLATASPPASFDDAVREARRQLADEARVHAAVDVAAARIHRIRPLPSDGDAGRVASAPGAARPEAPADAPPGTPREVALRQRDEAERARERTPREPAEQRLERWRGRLLDLTLRNRLLNHRDGKRSVPLVLDDPGAVADALAEGRSFHLHPQPSHLDPQALDPPAPGEEGSSATPETQRALEAHLRDERRAGRLRSRLDPSTLDHRLVALYRQARASSEEGGIGTVFLAVGMLHWFETPQSGRELVAPILLLPVTLRRRRVGEAMWLEQSDDEPMVNAALLEKLRRDFGVEVEGLDAPPRDDAGLDVPLVLRRVREAVREMPRWRVAERAVLGHFTFSKFLMWRDLTRRDRTPSGSGPARDPILDHPLVRHVLAGEPPPDEADGPLPDPQRLDDELDPRELLCPLDADATQLAAIRAAEQGRSLVVQGPPGTGKSQTIANLVVQNLAAGRRVLFVSEKRAALDVVHQRLERVGLGPFALELHSNRARKRAVLQQLAEPLNLPTPSETGWEAQADALRARRQELDRHAEAIGAPRALGDSVRDVVARLVGLRDAPRVPLAFDDPPAAFDAPRREALLDRAQQLRAAAEQVGDLASHPWRAASRVAWTPGLEDDARAAVDELAAAVDEAGEAAGALAAELELPDPEAWPRDRLDALRTTAELLTTSPEPPTALLEVPSWSRTRRELRDRIERGRRRRALWAGLAETWRPRLLQLDLDRLVDRYRRWVRRLALLAWLALWPARRLLKRAARGRLPRGRERVLRHLEDARRVAREDAALEEAAPHARELLGPVWRGPDTDWDEVEALVDWTDRFRAARRRLRDGLDAPQADAAAARLDRLAAEADEALAEGTRLRRTVDAWLAAHERLREVRDRLEEMLGLDPQAAWPAPDAAEALPRLRDQAATWRSGIPRLRDWSHWLRSRAAACEAGLQPLVAAAEAGRIGASELDRAADRSFHRWWLDETIRRDDVLRTFSRAEHHRRIEDFRRLDRELLDLAAEEARARLAARLPEPSGGAPDRSELGLLLRELAKKRNHRPVRRLFTEMPGLLGRLAPCVLMSPLSVAQYLEPGAADFDLVVFDEASQVPPWDALGALARARHAVVVGDPQQLPPTDFFERRSGADGEPSEAEDAQDLESILDECRARGMAFHRLGWHYRSRHEHLIAFSNRMYYDNALHTFPAADAEVPGLGVSWRHVPDGVYERSGRRHNRPEAEAVAAEVVRRLRDPAEGHRSIGVVTFSAAQQELIEDLLDEARQEHPDLEAAFEGRAERTFVKNLESVQGDERDVMLFSVCYGPDRSGRIAMHFGPLNRSGGERRLNVAVTRARQELVVFSTLTPDDIDLRRTRAVGAQHLKSFLRYAAEGPRALDATAGATGTPASPLEEDVRSALTGRGWEVDAQVGCSGYRIDLAVRDPEAPGRYRLGVECDGGIRDRRPRPHRPPGQAPGTARDRDRLREEVLEGLGWRIHRIWSLDWWHDPEAETERLEAALHAARRPRPEPGPAARGGDRGPGPEERGREPSPKATEASGEADAVGEALARYGTDRGDATYDDLPGATPYRPAALEPVDAGAPADFFSREAEPHVLEQLRAVARAEGPVHAEVLVDRIAHAWARKRAKRLRRHVEDLLHGLDRDEAFTLRGDVLWPPELDPTSWRGFRTPTDDARSRRDAEAIPVEERANAAEALLARHIALPAEDLVRELARLFGFPRTGHRIREAMFAGLDHLVETARARRDPDRGVVRIVS